MTKHYRRGKALTYDGILEAIEGEIQMVDQWRCSENLDLASTHYQRAEALIELLEVHNCGSTGGFDKGQQDSGSRSLQARFEWLRGKKP